MHIEQNVWEQEVMTGFDRNSLQTSQRNAASSDSNWGRDVVIQSVESGKSNVESIWLCEGVVDGSGVLARCDDQVASNALIVVSRSRAVFGPVIALSATKGCRSATFIDEVIFVY